MKGSVRSLGLILLAAATLVSSPATALRGTDPDPDDAGPDPTPWAPNAVHAVFETRVLPTLAGFEIDATLDVLEVEVAPLGGHTASEIRAAPEPVRGLFEAQVRQTIEAETQRLLPNADVRIQELRFDYGVEDLDADLYRPGVGINALIHVGFTPAFFGLPANAGVLPADLARAFLYSGGSYRLSQDLSVPAGYNVHHVVGAPGFLVLQRPGAPATDRLEFGKDNFAGSEPESVPLDFAVRLKPGTIPQNVLDGPLVRAQFIIDDATPLWKQAVPLLGGDFRGSLDLGIEVHSLESDLFASYPLPPQLSIPQVSGDLLRVALREDLVSQRDVEAFFEDLIRRSLEEGFGPDIGLTFDWEAFQRSLREPIGGPDGQTVEPLRVQAHATLPFESTKMLVSSSLGRLVGMTTGTSGSFELKNDGIWNADYTVAYPENVHVDVTDSAGLVENRKWPEREGFHVYLAKGASTKVHVDGRTDFDPLVFSIGLLEACFAGAAVWGATRKVRAFRRGKVTTLAA